MSSTVYLILMVGIITVVAAVVTPALILKRCAHCGRRAFIDTPQCRGCGQPFPPV
jgi:hypothetical protein